MVDFSRAFSEEGGTTLIKADSSPHMPRIPSHSPRIRIHNFQAGPQAKRLITSLLTAGLDTSNPGLAIRRVLSLKDHHLEAQDYRFNLSRYHRVVCVGAGKASGGMAVTLEKILGHFLEGGVVIVKDGYGIPCKKIKVIEAAHPVPDRRGVDATRQILSLVHSLTKQDLLIVLLSGGASSLLCAPAEGLTLTDKKRTTRLLLRSGATIQDINIIRKHLSTTKGGQLAQPTSATILTLLISDVPGDDLAVIGSGPTVPDPSTFQDAVDILQSFRIWTKVPSAVRRHFKKGIAGTIPETVKSSRKKTARHRHILLANNNDAIEAVAKTAKQLKLQPFVLPTTLQGEAKEIGNILGSLGRDLVEFGNPVRPPACLIAGGEPTVTVTGKGKGGRAQECLLAAARELTGLNNVFVAGFGTDGTDGPTEVAGAIIDGKTRERASRKGLDTQSFLDNNDSYHFFKQVGGHIITGPTGTNVNDIYLILAL